MANAKSAEQYVQRSVSGARRPNRPALSSGGDVLGDVKAVDVGDPPDDEDEDAGGRRRKDNFRLGNK